MEDEHPGAEQPGKGERTRLRILDVAVQRFAQDGFRRTSVSAIAREAGLTPAAVYAYFDGKGDLFTAAVDADASSLIDKALVELAGGPLRDRWPALIAQLGQRLPEHPLARRVLAGREPDVIDRLLELPSVLALRADVTAELAAGIVDGSVRGDIDPSAMAVGIETIVLALLMAGEQSGAGADEQRSAGALVVLDAALRPPSY